MLRGFRRLVPLVVILASACSRGESPDPSHESNEGNQGSTAFSLTDALQADGPLRGVAFTGHIDREDPKVRPTLAFTTQDTEVTAVIGLGNVDEGSTLVVTWYRVAGLDEREALFSHEIAVGPGGLAFSQAIAPNGLAPGVYDTAATMDGHVTHTPWMVREAGGSETTSATAQLASEDEADGVPGSGDGWYNDEFGPPPPGISNETCTFDSIDPSMIPERDVGASAWWLGPCTTGMLTATVSGPPMTIASSDAEGRVTGLTGQIDVCLLSGGSDLPGTVVHFEATGSASSSVDFTLPDHGESLAAGLVGLPAPGSEVEPGDRIDLAAFAIVMSPALGVKTLSVDDGSDLLESVGNLSGSDHPVPCDITRLEALIETTYEVPSGPPPIIELCATGVGFDRSKSKNCIRYYTGEVWEGTATSIVTDPQSTMGCGNPITIVGTVQLGVAEDGSVSGTYDATGPCLSEPHAEFTGTVTDAGFVFPQLEIFTNGSLIPRTSPTHAEGTFTNTQGVTEWETTWDLTCTTCT